MLQQLREASRRGQQRSKEVNCPVHCSIRSMLLPGLYQKTTGWGRRTKQRRWGWYSVLNTLPLLCNNSLKLLSTESTLPVSHNLTCPIHSIILLILHNKDKRRGQRTKFHQLTRFQLVLEISSQAYDILFHVVTCRFSYSSPQEHPVLPLGLFYLVLLHTHQNTVLTIVSLMKTFKRISNPSLVTKLLTLVTYISKVP